MIEAPAIAEARAMPIAEAARLYVPDLKRCGAELVGPCPVCGGRDRFAVHLRRNIWNCRGCERGGDPIDLVRHVEGVGFNEAVAALNGGSAGSDRPIALSECRGGAKTPPDDGERSARALAIWNEAAHPAGTSVERYLARRGVDLPIEAAGNAIRFHPACPFAGTRVPAMVALVRDIRSDEPRGLHRTALSADGHKVQVDSKDRLALGPIASGAVKLTPDVAVTLALGIGEGIETVLSLRLTPEFGRSPVWACLSAGGVKDFPVLAGVESLWIAVDNDPAGIRAAEACAARWQDAGREVFLVRPKLAGNDMNDVMKVAP